jgi:hypothetical protein
MKISNKQTLASILFLLTSFVCAAAPPPPPLGPPPPPGLPIDGFLIYGVALALFFGVKKILSFNRNN